MRIFALGGRAFLNRRRRLRAPSAADAHIADSIHEEAGGKPPVPWYLLIAIGLMNGTGNFITSLGLPHTPGLTQSLLGLLGIPLVLSLAWAFLGRRPSAWAAVGAVLIVAGSAFSSLRGVLNTDGDAAPVTVYW